MSLFFNPAFPRLQISYPLETISQGEVSVCIMRFVFKIITGFGNAL